MQSTENKCPVIVHTYDPSGGESYTLIDHNNREHRQWLGRHAYWAMRNDRTVITQPVSVADAFAINSAKPITL